MRTELDEMLGQVTGNRVQLQQVLFNLVSNAIEAMQSAADRKILIKSELESGGKVHVTVEDSGSGIDPKDIDKIFGSFFTTKIEGMGMGLSICRSIIESHGGRLWASPGHSRGRSFNSLCRPVNPGTSRQRSLALLVRSSHTARTDLCPLLAQSGHELVHCTCPRSGVKAKIRLAMSALGGSADLTRAPWIARL